jgi:hypothetical protein
LSVADEGYSRNVADEGYSRNVADEGYSRNVADEGYSRSYVSGIAFISYAQIRKIGKPNNSNFLEQQNKRARTRLL